MLALLAALAAKRFVHQARRGRPSASAGELQLGRTYLQAFYFLLEPKYEVLHVAAVEALFALLLRRGGAGQLAHRHWLLVWELLLPLLEQIHLHRCFFRVDLILAEIARRACTFTLTGQRAILEYSRSCRELRTANLPTWSEDPSLLTSMISVILSFLPPKRCTRRAADETLICCFGNTFNAATSEFEL